LIPYGLRNPFGVQALVSRYVEGEINSNTRGVEVRVANSTTKEVSLRMRSVTVVAGSVRGGGMCAVGRMSWRGRRAKDWGLRFESETKDWRGDVGSIIVNFIPSVSRWWLCGEEILKEDGGLGMNASLGLVITFGTV
jgi:hypothetical protein